MLASIQSKKAVFTLLLWKYNPYCFLPKTCETRPAVPETPDWKIALCPTFILAVKISDSETRAKPEITRVK